MTGSSLVYVVILNWNLKDDTAECIDSVLRSDYPKVRIIVVDNGSTDGSIEYLSSRFPEIHIIANEENRGFAEGNNIGIRHALQHGAEHVFILNNDTIVDGGLLRHLVQAAESDPQIGAVGPVIYYYAARRKIWWLGDRQHRLLPVPISVARGQEDRGQLGSALPVDYITGCAMLIKRAVLEQVGFFDPRLFWYYEDADLCRRIRQAGYGIVAVPRAKMWHKVSMTAKKLSPFARYLGTRNRIVFYRRHPHGPHPILTSLYLLIGALRTCAVDVCRRDFELIKPLARGLYDGYKGDLTELRYYG